MIMIIITYHQGQDQEGQAEVQGHGQGEAQVKGKVEGKVKKKKKEEEGNELHASATHEHDCSAHPAGEEVASVKGSYAADHEALVA